MHQTLDGGCTDFSRVLKPKIENGDLMGPNGDLMGTQKLEKVPMGTRVSKWGPMWEQCFGEEGGSKSGIFSSGHNPKKKCQI